MDIAHPLACLPTADDIMQGGQVAANTKATEAVVPGQKALSRLFAVALATAKLDSAGSARKNIGRIHADNKRAALADAFSDLCESWADAIRKFYPRFIALGQAHEPTLPADVVTWAEENVWQKLVTQCGLPELQAGNFTEHASRAVRFWLMVASGCDLDAIVSPQPGLEAWDVPRWLADSKAALDRFVRELTQDMHARLLGVVEEQKDEARVNLALNGTPCESVTPLDGFLHSEDYRTVTVSGRSYSLTGNAANVVRVLHRALLKGEGPLSSELLRRRTGGGKLWDQFRSRDGLAFRRKFIVRSGVNFYSLQIPRKKRR